MLDGPTRQGDVRERAHVVVHRHLVLGPQPLHHLQALLEAPHALPAWHLEGVELHVPVAQPHAEDEVPLPDDVERGHAFRHFHGVVQPDEEDPGHARHVTRIRGQARQVGNELELAHAFAQVVLTGGDGVPAAIPREAGHEALVLEGGDHVAPHRVLIGQEDPDLHGSSFRRPLLPLPSPEGRGMFRCQRQSCWEARRAPSVIDLNLAHAISGSTRSAERPKVAKPQSVPAITRSRPTTSA